jgi:hypothetical protein
VDIFSLDWFPTGAWGAFVLFMLPIGPGTTAGILVGKNGGLDAIGILAVYLASDIVTALYLEPVLRFLIRIAARFAWARAIGAQLAQVAERTQIGSGRLGQALGLGILSLGGGLPAGALALPTTQLQRSVAWASIITGDMLYFGFILAAALGLASVLPDDRLVFVAILVLVMVVGPLTRRLSTTKSNHPTPDPLPTTGT